MAIWLSGWQYHFKIIVRAKTHTAMSVVDNNGKLRNILIRSSSAREVLNPRQNAPELSCAPHTHTAFTNCGTRHGRLQAAPKRSHKWCQSRWIGKWDFRATHSMSRTTNEPRQFSSADESCWSRGNTIPQHNSSLFMNCSEELRAPAQQRLSKLLFSLAKCKEKE